MRKPAKIKPHLTTEQMQHWLNQAPDKASYQRRLAIWMTCTKRLHAHEIAQMTGVSTPSIWLWIKQYNQLGPVGLDRQGRGGRHFSYLTARGEAEIIAQLIRIAQNDGQPNAKTAQKIIETRLGHKVSLSYVYRLLNRHNWPTILSRIRPTQTDFQTLTRPWQRT